MTNTKADLALLRKLAARIPDLAEELAERVESDVRHGDWSEPERGMDFVKLIRRAQAWPGMSVDPNRPNALICSVEGPNDHVWGHVAGDLLDVVSQELPQDVLERPGGDETVKPYVPSATEVCIEELAAGRYGLFW